MGWFWAESPAASSSRPVAPHPLPSSAATPPLGCPVQAAPPTGSFPPQKSSSSSVQGSCPVKAPNEAISSEPARPSALSRLNPLNYMPSNLSQTRASNQTVYLPVERETSSIPRGDADTNWEYPSPQQMYNAMLRKGYDDTPQDAVESMVAVHNFLNEGAWAEIVEWERRFSRGLGYGWQTCKYGEQGSVTGAGMAASEEEGSRPKLLRFQGRPNEMTPKARLLQVMGQVYPSKFGGEPPFDRHDWFVQRQAAAGQTREVRYVIDYYSGPPEPTGEPVFYLDVRPAVDRPSAAVERMMRWGGDVWHRASGASVREHASR
ncbi:holocytochrome c synthase [Lambiella insularis]|nr:holocytochrome c synthase [Lambiella insularis]